MELFLYYSINIYVHIPNIVMIVMLKYNVTYCAERYISDEGLRESECSF